MSLPDPSGEWPQADLESVSGCPVCGSERSVQIYDGLRDVWFGAAPGAWRLLECAQCGSAYLNPRPSPASIGRAYGGYYTHTDVPSARTSWLRQRWVDVRQARLSEVHGPSRVPAGPAWSRWAVRGPLQRLIDHSIMRDLPAAAAGDRLLDVGCGAGGYLKRAQSLGWQVDGVEPDLRAAEQARAQGLEVFAGSFDDWFAQRGLCGGQTYARITLNHVLEHVHDPAWLLGGCRDVLRPDGRLWIETPNWGSRSRQRAAERWRGLEPPRHLVLFTPASLELLLRQCGLTPVRWSYNPLADWSLARARTVTGESAGSPWRGALTSLGRLLSRPPRHSAHYDHPFITLEAARA